MVAEIASEDSVSLEFLHRVIHVCEKLDQFSDKFLTNIELYNYFLKENEISDEEVLKNEDLYGRKRAYMLYSTLMEIEKEEKDKVFINDINYPMNNREENKEVTAGYETGEFMHHF